MGKLIFGAFVALFFLPLNGCAPFQEAELLKPEFWASSPLKDNDEAELGLAELGKGNFALAETHFQKALKRDERDVHALLGLGILYQNTGQVTKAREMYEAILAMRPGPDQQFVVWNVSTARPVAEIASINLALIDSGGVVASLDRAAAGRGADSASSPPSGASAGSKKGQPNSSKSIAVASTSAHGIPASAALSENAPDDPMVMDPADQNIVGRFQTIRALRDEGLITRAEYNARRQANLGALLPLTSPPPASGLDRPVPGAQQISGRLRAIGRALEMRAMTVAQHSSERSMIVDALLPAAPVAVANSGRPPHGLMEAADAVRRLEALKAEDLITSDEYTRERAAIESAMQPAPEKAKGQVAKKQMAKPEASPKPVAKPSSIPKKQASDPKGQKSGVHLASYRSQRAADRGWSILREAHKDLLGDLSREVSRINLGTKGVFYRLKAGPLVDKAAAHNLCRELKKRRQYCEPTILSTG